MNGHNRGFGSGLSLLLLLLAALIAAYLAVKQFSASGGEDTPAPVEQSAAVEQAQEAVDRLNEAQQNAMDALEGFGG
jgi:uncharacterized protein (UPF0333 family)